MQSALDVPRIGTRAAQAAPAPSAVARPEPEVAVERSAERRQTPSPLELLEEVMSMIAGGVAALMPFMLLSIPAIVLFVVLPLILVAIPAVAVALLLGPPILLVRTVRRWSRRAR